MIYESVWDAFLHGWATVQCQIRHNLHSELNTALHRRSHDLTATQSTRHAHSCIAGHEIQESRVVARKPRDAAAVLFGLKFADDIHYKFKSSQTSKARLQSSKHTGTKQNLTQNGDSRSFKVTCFGVRGKVIRH